MIRIGVMGADADGTYISFSVFNKKHSLYLVEGIILREDSCPARDAALFIA